jgi:hypothetical protein
VKRQYTGVIASIATLCVLIAVTAPSIAAQGNTGNSVAQGGAPPPADFGSPPSGQIPILFNDHHVYAKPDILKQGRVLAALVRGGTLLIPLRSMFEQMGATVSWDAGSQTATVSKPGAEVKVTVGKPEVVINGETRPLDVPPMMYQGAVLVPVRVISEGMGAYVQWVPDRRIVVVRYIPATPPPSPAPPPPAAPPPPPPPPTPRPLLNEAYVAGDYIFSPSVYNEFNSGQHAAGGNGGYNVHGAATFNLGDFGLMVGANFQHWPFPHDCTVISGVNQSNCYVTVIGNNGSAVVPTTNGLYDQNVDARLGLGISKFRIYIAGSYIWLSNNYGYPTLDGVGFGGQRLPDLSHFIDFFGEIFYYPTISGNASVSVPNPFPRTGFTSVTLPLQYDFMKYDIGATVAIPTMPVFLELGWQGNSWQTKQNAPINRTYNGPFAGLGLKFFYP